MTQLTCWGGYANRVIAGDMMGRNRRFCPSNIKCGFSGSKIKKFSCPYKNLYFSPPTARTTHLKPCHNERTQGTYQDEDSSRCQPQQFLSILISSLGKHRSEARLSQTHENRLSAHVMDRPRPPSRLQSQRKVTEASS